MPNNASLPMTTFNDNIKYSKRLSDASKIPINYDLIMQNIEKNKNQEKPRSVKTFLFL